MSSSTDDATTNLPSNLDELAATAVSYASAHGLEIEKKHADGISYLEPAPFSLLPNAFPDACFEQARSLAPVWNLLVERIRQRDEKTSFLTKTLASVIESDPYTAKLLELYQAIYLNEKDRFALQAHHLGIHRSDYMLHDGGKSLKQVELNTIAASFASLATKVAQMHRLVTSRYESSVREFLHANIQVIDQGSPATPPGVPENPALKNLALAMHATVAAYQATFTPKLPLIVLFIVQEGETNTVDQRMLEFQLWQDHQVPVVRLSLQCVQDQVKLDDADTGALILNGEQEIALVYYRAGYAPTDYPSGYNGKEWLARAFLERSRATKAPSLPYHLTGTKKVQQELARPGVLELFLDDSPEAMTNMREAMAGLYSLGDDATEQDLEVVKTVLLDKEKAECYVLKPQREGGGYNYYGSDLFEKLEQNATITDDDKVVLKKSLGEFILMERLFPPQQPAILLRRGQVEGSGMTISELGCFGTILAGSDGTIVQNCYAGFLLRTKFSNVNEGGVASGFATLSSPHLC